MDKSPIEFLVRAPGQHTAAPAEAEPDGRFSELLRQPAEAKAVKPMAEPQDPAVAIAVLPAGDAAEAMVEAAAGSGEGSLPRRGVSAELGPIEPPAIVPTAITHGAAAPVAPAATISGAGDHPPPPALQSVPTASNPAPVASAPAGAGERAALHQTNPPAGLPATAPAGTEAGVPALPANPVQPDAGTKTQPTQPVGDPARPRAETVTAQPSPSDRRRPAGGPPPVVVTPVKTDGPLPDAAGRARQATTVNPLANSSHGAETAVESAPVAVTATADIVSKARPTPRPASLATPGTEPKAGVADSDSMADRADLPASRSEPKPAVAAGAALIAGAKPAGAATRTMAADPIIAPASPAAAPEIRTADAAAPTVLSEPAGMAAASQTARSAAESATPTQTATGNTAPPPAAEQVVLQIRRAVTAGVDRLTVQLKPATLGRVEVQMEVGFDGRVQAVISADRPETLSLLQRDARALTTALADAGLQADSGSLSFNLRGQTGDQPGSNESLASDAAPAATGDGDGDGDDRAEAITLTLGTGRVNITV